MEDDDFGFTKREDRVLRRVLHNAETRESEEYRAGRASEMKSDEDSAAAAAGARGTGHEASDVAGDGGGSVIPDDDAAEGVSGRAGGGRISGDGGGSTSPETGSSEPGKRPSPSGASVSRRTSNIPNVVEYHLKVKPDNELRQPEPAEPETTKPARATGNAKDDSDPTRMRTDCRTPLSSRDDRKSLTAALSKLSIDSNVFEGSTDLPQVFQVKYLGSHDARGLWGIKHTRRPVDNMVASAKSLPSDTILPLVKLVVAEAGVSLHPLGRRKHEAGLTRSYAIESVSYGVQDLVYTRVFSMIVVRTEDTGKNSRRTSPFECHAFVCESKHHARQLTYALATAFQIYSDSVKSRGKSEESVGVVKKRFAIDLRSPEEIETDLNLDSEA